MYKFSLSFFYILLLAPLQTYIWHKKILALLTDLLKVKNNIFCQTIATHKNVHIVQIPAHKYPLDVSCGNLNMAIAHYRYTSKKIAKRWRSKNVITSMGLRLTRVLFSFLRQFFLCYIYLFIFSVNC